MLRPRAAASRGGFGLFAGVGGVVGRSSPFLRACREAQALARPCEANLELSRASAQLSTHRRLVERCPLFAAHKLVSYDEGAQSRSMWTDGRSCVLGCAAGS